MMSEQPWDRLCRWYQQSHRNLPWRNTSDPYAIWVSEIMLQQTQVKTVIPYYERFLLSFPTIKALADADIDSVRSHWSGLGYYSRASHLHRGARYLVERCDGQFPRDLKTCLKIPGIGPYTAGAILSIAFDQAVPIVDGNVQRVFSRYFAFHPPSQAARAKSFFWDKATQWVSKSQPPRILNQALMELGATLCTRHNPDCDRCPLRVGCQACKRGLQNHLPIKTNRPSTQKLWWLSSVFCTKDSVFLRQNDRSGWWQGLWDFPHEEASSQIALEKAIQSVHSRIANAYCLELPAIRHTVTRYSLQVRPVLCVVRNKTSVRLEGAWHKRRDAETLPLSSLAKKILVMIE
ncbi:MAG: A/G-specific adenine glycosylase [Deltaproteobacteria bacterium]|nr:A/G-specific adenine glycosylase [Deltaproteobacteria bacterium]